MPIATKRRELVAPPKKRRPSDAARSESGYSRRSSVGSFKTATGASEHAPGASQSEDDQDNDQEQEDEDQLRDDGASDDEIATIDPHKDQDFASDDDDADDTENASRRKKSEGLVAASRKSQDVVSSSDSEDSPAIFNKNPSSDTSTIHKSPPTSHDDAASNHAIEKEQRSPLRSKTSRHKLLTPDAALTPKGRPDRKNVRASHASHLTLPYQQSEVGDYRGASNRLSRLTLSSYNPRSRAPSRAASVMDGDFPDMEMRDARYRSVSERGGGSRASRLLPSASVLEFGGSVRGSYQSHRGAGSRYASSYIEQRSPSKTESLASLAAGIYHRDSDRLSITSRATARKPASIMSQMLDADTQVYPGTRIRKYIEPQLTESMRRVMKQFSGHNLQDHRCSGYPIAVFVGATAIDTGSIIHPHVSGAVSLYFGPGHPKNMASLLPEEDRTPSHIPNPKAPTPSSLSRRAELRSAITALHSIYELYRGRACAHVCIDSAYVAKAWGTWIPTWELKGWPGEDDEREGDRERWEEEYHERRRNQRRAYDRRGTRYMDLPDRRSRDGYASDGGRYRDSRASPRRNRYGDRDDWLSSDPYVGGRKRRDGSRAPPSPRRRGGRSNYDYSSEEEDYPRRNGSRRRYEDEDDYRYGDPYSPDRSPPPRPPMRRAPGRRLVDEDLLRELADIRYEFAHVERNRQGSAHLYLIDRTNNPADRMARAVAKSEGSFLRADEDDARSELGLHVDQARLSDEDELDEQEQEWLETRSHISTMSKSTRGGQRRSSSRNSTRGSIISSATGRLRTSLSLPAGHLKGGSRRQLDTFAEEDEDDLAADARSMRSVRSARSSRTQRSRKSTRAERERDEYLARQEKLDEEANASVRRSTTQSSRRSASRASCLAPPASERGGGSRLSIDSRRGPSAIRLADLLSPDSASARGSMDSRRRVSNVRSQPDMRDASRAQNGRSTVRSALASAAVLRGDDEEAEQEDMEYRPQRSMQIHNASPGGPRHPRSRMISEQEYPDMDDLVPPTRGWDGGSVYSRNSVDKRRPPPDSPGSQRRGLFGTPKQPASPSGSQRKSPFGLFSNRSTPSLHRSPAPEDADYEWGKKSKKKRQQREWHSTTPHDYRDKSRWEDDEAGTAKKGGFLSRMFGRKK
ncbi:uncharacterized protein SPSC_03684 [Sporisorium scitamineum]|uniref:Uncharacterized protein n=1 Tax=Sporisorium scitamineum TaxID=49012 RepID=A0A0F7S572_9BASI|nr:uncharacterized protein SPSC_03684 [Sporisorium scitamineum]CDW97481.1 hypothetical protein [Sporisorium scitamineum]